MFALVGKDAAELDVLVEPEKRYLWSTTLGGLAVKWPGA
jgi:hypothetical protein